MKREEGYVKKETSHLDKYRPDISNKINDNNDYGIKKQQEGGYMLEDSRVVEILEDIEYLIEDIERYGYPTNLYRKWKTKRYMKQIRMHLFLAKIFLLDEEGKQRLQGLRDRITKTFEL